jgi:ATP:corrinoid adenosyltransferase
MKGLIHVYCGNGKGKTTAATGLALRMAGSGRKVLIVRFLKSDNSAELKSISKIKDIEIMPVTRTFGFYNKMSEAQRREAKFYYEQLLTRVIEDVNKKEYGLLFLDEISVACRYKLVDIDKLVEFLSIKPKELEVVITGRNPAEKLLKLADYVTEMKAIKHPYEKGIMARRGVEY